MMAKFDIFVRDIDLGRDMLPDGWEVGNGLSPLSASGGDGAGGDPDDDGLTNLQEYQRGTKSRKRDTDGDGLSDGDEVNTHNTNPLLTDTDGDGVRDGDEVPHSPGSCPNDPDDEGNPANCVTLRLTVGDPSGSHSERWNFEVFEEATGRDVVRHCDDGFGTPGSAEYALVKGKAYTFSLRWIGTNLDEGPDYDWQALINDSDETGAREGLYGTGAFIVEDSYGLLTEERHGNEFDITIGETGRIIVPKVEIVGLDKTVTWPCTCAESRVIVAANVAPATVADNVNWTASCFADNEIRIFFLDCQTAPPAGTPADLQDADFFAVFAPPTNFTTEFTVGLSVTDYQSSDNTHVLVHAVPNGKSTSTSMWLNPPTKPYGRAYKYTFSSSGGDLDGVRISERVTFANDPYWYQRGDIVYGQEIWDLDSTGMMDEYDEYSDPYDLGQININRFHPVPPGSGTPVIYQTLQTYGWKCPLCSTYRDFFSHEIYTGLSSYDESSAIPKYETSISNGIIFEEDYLGNPFLDVDDIVSSSLTVIANGSNTFQVGWSGTYQKSSKPQAMDLNWNWDCEDSLGCTFSSLRDNPVTITTGTQAGTLNLWINLNPIRSSDPTFKAHSISIQLIEP